MSATLEDTRGTAAAGDDATSARRGPRRLLGDPALRAAWLQYWRSRALIWVVGCSAYLILGVREITRARFDPYHVTTHYGWLGNVLAAPAVRWDSLWYLGISHIGYPTLPQAGFFPLYPLLIHAVTWVTVSDAIAAVLISVVASIAGLWLVYRLTELELGPDVAGTTVRLLAFAPFALYLSAVYGEGLFLALTAGTFYAARRERWWLAGVLGGLAALTRVNGVLLVAPVLILFLYGPRSVPVVAVRSAAVARSRLARLLTPRYRPDARILWVALIGGGLLAFCAFTASQGLGFFAPFNAQHIYWSHRFTGPVIGIWRGMLAAGHQIGAIVSGNNPSLARGAELLEFCVLILCAIGVVGIFRRLPAAYGVYVLLGLLVPLSSPTLGVEPLKGFDRYASMMFPLFMWAAAVARERRRERLVMAVFVVLLIGFTVEFATWRFVGENPL